MDLDYEPPRPRRRLTEAGVYAFALKVLIAYLVISILTFPFLNAIWLGELPVLALVQLPKTLPAEWLRTGVVMPLIRHLGLSRGSFSPDYGIAGPYALVATYLIPFAVVIAVVWWRTRMARPFRLLTCAFVLLTVIDFCMMLAFARGPGLTIYG